MSIDCVSLGGYDDVLIRKSNKNNPLIMYTEVKSRGSDTMFGGGVFDTSTSNPRLLLNRIDTPHYSLSVVCSLLLIFVAQRGSITELLLLFFYFQARFWFRYFAKDEKLFSQKLMMMNFESFAFSLSLFYSLL